MEDTQPTPLTRKQFESGEPFRIIRRKEDPNTYVFEREVDKPGLWIGDVMGRSEKGRVEFAGLVIKITNTAFTVRHSVIGKGVKTVIPFSTLTLATPVEAANHD